MLKGGVEPPRPFGHRVLPLTSRSVVPRGGVEPPRHRASGPKPDASTVPPPWRLPTSPLERVAPFRGRGAGSGTRTRTAFRPLRSERSTSTNSATPAWSSVWCPEGDLNPQDLSVASLSDWCVYQFHHLGEGVEKPGRYRVPAASGSPVSATLSSVQEDPVNVRGRQEGLLSNMAETEGLEPSSRLTPAACFPNRSLSRWGHVSSRTFLRR